MHIRDYERPEGWSKGQPEVLVSKHVVGKLGMPVVRYNELHQFVTDDLGVPYDDKTSIRLYGRSSISILGGFHQPYTRTVHVNALTTEKLHQSDGGVMRIVAHELRHRSDSTNRKVVTAAEIAARYASYKLGYDVSMHIPPLSAAPVLGAIATKQVYYGFEPPERRARKQEKELARSPHSNDILFPKSPRTMITALSGKLDASQADQLGVMRFHELSEREDVKLIFDSNTNVQITLSTPDTHGSEN